MNCKCGNLTSLVICSNMSGMHTGLLASAIRDLNMNNGNGSLTINFKDLGKKTDKLDCNEECAKFERNRRLALALQIDKTND